MTVRPASSADLPTCLAIRHEVFVVGQDVPEELEVDGYDETELCFHVVAEVDGRAVGTARLRAVDGHAKAERVAVLEPWRGRKVGVALMHALEAEARRRGEAEIVLHAQIQVVGFYVALGYEPDGPPFDEAGIVHVAMSKPLG